MRKPVAHSFTHTKQERRKFFISLKQHFFCLQRWSHFDFFCLNCIYESYSLMTKLILCFEVIDIFFIKPMCEKCSLYSRLWE